MTRLYDHEPEAARTAGLWWASCSCGWNGRLPRLTRWGAQKAHTVHVLAAAGGRLDGLWLPEPNRYRVRWEIPLDEVRWRPDEVRVSDPVLAKWLADFLDSAPSRLRNIQIIDEGPD